MSSGADEYWKAKKREDRDRVVLNDAKIAIAKILQIESKVLKVVERRPLLFIQPVVLNLESGLVFPDDE